MLIYIKFVCLSLLLLLGLVSFAGAASSNELNGSNLAGYTFICDGQTIIIYRTETGWALWGDTNVEVSTTYDGWMLTHKRTGIERSLSTNIGEQPVLYVYSDNDAKEFACFEISN